MSSEPNFRLIPSLLLKNKGLVKGRRFNDYTYVGDPINAIRIFNDLQVDELFFFDITATEESRKIPFPLVQKLANECFMPFAVGGGINSIEYIADLIRLGSKKYLLTLMLFRTRTSLKKQPRYLAAKQLLYLSM